MGKRITSQISFSFFFSFSTLNFLTFIRNFILCLIFISCLFSFLFYTFSHDFFYWFVLYFFRIVYFSHVFQFLILYFSIVLCCKTRHTVHMCFASWLLFLLIFRLSILNCRIRPRAVSGSGWPNKFYCYCKILPTYTIGKL